MVDKHQTFVKEIPGRPIRDRRARWFHPYLVWCSAGDFEDEAMTKEEARRAGIRHENYRKGENGAS